MEKSINHWEASGTNLDTQSACHHNISRLNNLVRDKSQIVSIIKDALTMCLLVSVLIAALYCQDGLNDTIVALKGGY